MVQQSINDSKISGGDRPVAWDGETRTGAGLQNQLKQIQESKVWLSSCDCVTSQFVCYTYIEIYLERFASSVLRKSIILARDYGAEATKMEVEKMETLQHNLLTGWTKECCIGHAATMLAKRFCKELFHQSLIVGFHLHE